eukprot:2581837-Rhodomonas_salina.1
MRGLIAATIPGDVCVQVLESEPEARAAATERKMTRIQTSRLWAALLLFFTLIWPSEEQALFLEAPEVFRV